MNPLTPKELGARMRAARESCGESLTTAEARTGISAVVLGSWERCDRNPSLWRAMGWAEQFNHHIVLIGPDEDIVTSRVAAGEVYLTYVVVYGDGGEIDCDNHAEAQAIADHMPGAKVGHRRGAIEFGGYR